MGEDETQTLVQLAWDALPRSHRRLLEQVGASRWEIVERPLGDVVFDLLRSSGRRAPDSERIRSENEALGIWVPELRLVLINEGHREIREADRSTREALLTWLAWHEWGHALSVTAFSDHDPSEARDWLSWPPPESANASVREAIVATSTSMS